MFPCQNIDPNNEDELPNMFLVADLSIDCESSRYETGVVIAVVMIFVYPIGIPAFYFYSLYKKREEINNRRQLAMIVDGKPVLPDGLIVLEFLFRAYRPEFWYFEVFETYRRLVMTAILSVIATGSSGQIVCAMTLTLVFIKFYDEFKPYDSPKVARLAEIAQFQILFTFFGALIIRNNLLGSDSNDLVGGSLIPINLSVILLPIYYEINQPKAADKKLVDPVTEATVNPIVDGSMSNSNAVEIELSEIKNAISNSTFVKGVSEDVESEGGALPTCSGYQVREVTDNNLLIDDLIKDKEELASERKVGASKC
jgi:hypothetical protein